MAVGAQANGSVLTIYSRAIGKVGDDVAIAACMGTLALEKREPAGGRQRQAIYSLDNYTC